MLAPPPLDPRALRLQFDRRAPRFEEADFLLREVERRTLERMDYIKLAPTDVLDVGCGLGAGAQALAARWPEADVTAVDQSVAMARRARSRLAGDTRAVARALAGVRRLLGAAGGPAQAARGVRVVAADTHALPFADASFDLVWSNLALHWFVDPLAAVREWRRVLRPEGLLMFSAFGVDTLAELRAAGMPTIGFPDLHDVGDALVAAGLAQPVMDMERLSLTYQEPQRLLDDLRALGGDALASRRRGLAGRARLAALRAALAARPDPLSLTFELVYGHAWAPAPRRLPEGYAPVRVVRQRP